MTGYELKKLFDTSVAHFWSAELSQIYPTLKRLESEGLVEMAVEVQADRPNRKVYSITEDGRRELLEWLATPQQLDQMREPLLINVFFGAALSKKELLSVLRQRVDELTEALHEHGPAPGHTQQLAEAVGLRGDSFFWVLTIDAYLRRMEGEIAWLEEAMRKIEQADNSLFGPGRSPAPAIDVRKALAIIAKHMPPGPHVVRKKVAP